MYEPELKRENTIGINFIEGCCEEELYEIIIEQILGIPEDEVEGIDDRGNTRFIVKVTSGERFEYTCSNFIGRNIRIRSGYIVQVEDVSTYKTRISLTNVPFEMNNEMVKELFERYGKVVKCQYQFPRNLGNIKGLKTGYRSVWMEVSHPIPLPFLLTKLIPTFT